MFSYMCHNIAIYVKYFLLIENVKHRQMLEIKLAHLFNFRKTLPQVPGPESQLYNVPAI